MTKWQYFLRQENGLFFWYLLSCAGNLLCRSTVGFQTSEEAQKHLSDFHPEEHF